MSHCTDSTRRHFLGSFLGLPLLRRRATTLEIAGIRFRRLRRSPYTHRYLLIHGDESTARQVLTEHMERANGIAYLVMNLTRTVPFEGGQLDPNRLFSRVGARANLRKLNPDWTGSHLDAALDKLDRGRPNLVKALTPPPNGRIVALHNNAHGYSMQDEIETSDRTALNDKDHPHEFMLCTDPADFDRLARGGFNVLLQHSGPKEDDGSLSRLAARSGFRYVNIEAALGEIGKQQRMLAFLEWALP